MANVSKSCKTCGGSGAVKGSICKTCIGTGALPATGMPKYLVETLDGIVSNLKIQQEYLEKILKLEKVNLNQS